MKRLALLLLLAGCTTVPVKQQIPVTPPMPTTAPVKRSAPVAPQPPVMRNVTLEFAAETTDTNYGRLMSLNLQSRPDLTSTNWTTVWTAPYPLSTNNYPYTNYGAGSWWTSNYFVTFQVTLTNQPPDADFYRVFYNNPDL